MAESPPPADERFDDLLSRLLDGRLDTDQRAVLDGLLANDPALADRFVEAMDLHAMMQWEHGLVEHISAETANERALLEELFGVARQQRRLHEIEDRASALLREDLEQQRRFAHLQGRDEAEQDTRPIRQIVIPKAVVWLGLAAALLLAATLFLADTKRSGDSPPVVQAPGEETPVVPGADPVASLEQGFEVRWDGLAPDGDGRIVPGRYVMSAGWARVRTSHGVDLVLEAPVAFELGRDNALVLSSGQLVADVPERARGFTVQTPGGRVVDGGTTFGVAVGPAGRALTHVFEGVVTIGAVGSVGDARLRLTRDEAALLRSDGSVTREASAPELFAQEVPATAYQAAILTSRPMCYWRGPIDEATRRVTDHGWLGAHGQASAGVQTTAEGFSADDPSGSLAFDGGRSSAVSVPRRDVFAFQDAFTIEVWCWIEPGHTGFMRVLSTRSDTGGVGLGINGTDVHSIGSAVNNIPVLTLFGRKDIIGTRPLPEGRWLHLVAVVESDGGARLFVDGYETPVRTQVMSGGPPTAGEGASLMIGRNPYTGGGVQAWDGRLDEIAIYDYALTGDEVLAHYEAFARR